MATRKTAAKKAAPAGEDQAVKQSSSRAVATWEEELAKQADVAAGMEENTGGGKFFGLKGGILTWNDAIMPDNQMAVIVLDHVLETVYYEGDYDPDNPTGPVAFAFGRDEKTLTWHEKSDPEFAGQLCRESEVCQWGSADKGRGKAAKETRRLALIPAGHFKNGKFEPIEDEDHFATVGMGFMKLPVMSVQGFSGFVKQIAGALRRPPHGIFTKVKVVPDAKSQFRVVFEAIDQVPNELMETIMKRHAEAKSIIEFPYEPFEEQAEAKPNRNKAGRQAPAKKAPAKRSPRKY